VNGKNLVLDGTAPTASTALFRDSPELKRGGGNPWKQVATWSDSPTGLLRSFVSFADLHIWLGLKNGDDQGTRFDLRAEILKNGVQIASGETYCVSGVMRNATKALETTVALGTVMNGTFGPDGILSLRILARMGTNGMGVHCGGHANTVGLRLYFDPVTRPAGFDATFFGGAGGV
jgi:hypothetical protein